MSVRFIKETGRWFFEFDKIINEERHRATKTLPKGWSRAEAQEYDRVESNRLFGVATGVIKQRALIEDAVAKYIQHHCPKLKTGDDTIKELARIYWVYKGRYIDELTDVALTYTENAFREEVVNGKKIKVPLAPASVKNRLSYLRAAVKYAQKFHGIGKDVPIAVPIPTVNNARDMYATRAEMLQIARKCDTRSSRAFVRIAFYSGMRLSEILSLGKEDDEKINFKGGEIYLDDGTFILFNTKNGTNRVVPIHPKIRVLCRYLPITFTKIQIQRQIRKAMNEAGFPDLHLHDIRHSTASSLISNDVDIHMIGELLGHKDKRSTARYSHLYKNKLQAMIRKIN